MDVDKLASMVAINDFAVGADACLEGVVGNSGGAKDVVNALIVCAVCCRWWVLVILGVSVEVQIDELVLFDEGG